MGYNDNLSWLHALLSGQEMFWIGSVHGNDTLWSTDEAL